MQYHQRRVTRRHATLAGQVQADGVDGTVHQDQKHGDGGHSGVMIRGFQTLGKRRIGIDQRDHRDTHVPAIAEHRADAKRLPHAAVVTAQLGNAGGEQTVEQKKQRARRKQNHHAGIERH